MKYTLILICLCALKSSAQENSPKTKLDSIQINLTKAGDYTLKCHKQFQTGVAIYGCGLASIGIGVAKLQDNTQVKTGLFFTGLGGLAILAGSIVMMDSHKYLYYSGYYLKMAGNGFSVGLNF